MLVPEIFRQFHDTRVSLIYRLEHLVTGVVLSNQSESFGLGTHTDILRHKNHWTSKKTFLKAQCDRQYLVIVLEELDDHKQGQSGIARSTRQAMRLLSQVLDGAKASGVSLDQGIPLSGPSNGLASGRLFL